MNKTQVTLTGWLGSDVTTRSAGDATVASFRLAATPRRYNPRTEEWFDGDTQWYSVNAWRQLAGNCAASLRRGDPVVVHGKLSARRWTSAAGVETTSFEIEAAVVGHDLNRGASSFAKSPSRATPVERPVAEEPAAPELAGAAAPVAPEAEVAA